MDSQQILEAARKYRSWLEKHNIEPKEFPSDFHLINEKVGLDHCLWMTLQIEKFLKPGRAYKKEKQKLKEKAERWICFIQGFLWSTKRFTISEFKDDNRSKEKTA